MVLTIKGRQSSDPASKECCWEWDVIARSLAELVYEGRVDEDKFNSLNWPVYHPSTEELRDIIDEEGSFHIDMSDSFELNMVTDNSDLQNDNEVMTKGLYISRVLRAVTKVVLAKNFGEDIIDDLFHKFADHMNEYFADGHECFNINIVMSLIRK